MAGEGFAGESEGGALESGAAIRQEDTRTTTTAPTHEYLSACLVGDSANSGDNGGSANCKDKHQQRASPAEMAATPNNEAEEEGYRSSMGAVFGRLDSKELGSVLLFLSSRELLAWREVSKVDTAVDML